MEVEAEDRAFPSPVRRVLHARQLPSVFRRTMLVERSVRGCYEPPMDTSTSASLSTLFRKLRQTIARPVVRAWLALGVLWLLFELPALGAEKNFSWRALRAPGDLLLFFTLAAATRAQGLSRSARPVLIALWVMLFVFNLDRAIFSRIMRE